MKIKNINIRNDGYILCESAFYTVDDIINENKNFEFNTGVNVLHGEIDSGNFAVSYLISMYNKVNKETLFLPFEATVNGQVMPLADLTKYACYMDLKYPLFASNRSVERLISSGLKKSGLQKTVKDIKNLFGLDDDRFQRPLKCVGNERFRAMAAVAYSYDKQIYCFPWMSKMRFDYYGKNISWLLQVLESLGKIIILPCGDGYDTM